MAVEVGLVDGTIAATTPNGSAISMTLRSSRRRDDADGFHRPDEVVDLLGGEEVLLDLVGDDAVAGFLVRQPRERLGLRRDGGRHGVDDRVDLVLGQLRQRRRGLLGAARERARFADRGEVAIGRGRGLRAMRDRRRGYDAFASFGLRQDLFDFGVRARDHVHRDQLADAPRGGRAGVGGGLHRSDVAAHHHGDVARADVFLADQDDVGGLDHGVGRLDRADQPLGFDHSQRFEHQ